MFRNIGSHYQLAYHIFDREDSDNILPDCRRTSTRLHGVTRETILLLVVTAVRTSILLLTELVTVSLHVTSLESTMILSFLSLLFEKIKTGLWDNFVVCVPPIIAIQRLGKHVPATTNTRETEEMLDASFSMGPCRIKGKQAVIQTIHRCILYINKEQNLWTCGPTPGSWWAVTGPYLTPPRGAGPLTHGIMFHKNSFLPRGSKIVTLNL
jgi:hypothetical protein